MPADPIRVRDLFLEAIERPQQSRHTFLDVACGGDPELRAAVERLLAAAADPASILEPRPLDGAEAQRPLADGTVTFSGDAGITADYTALPDEGTVLGGKYKLVEEIGEGGMGTVWMAQQTEPVKRVVAVKLIKAGMDSKGVLARFGAERQALALMDHPNIAKVLDAGATPDGRPYFVMELVKGVPITQYCDEHKLTPRQRLELFVPVCHAIQHAHQKGIIHRDIKPNNVLVAMYDDRPVPKVIDFGIAKAAGLSLTDQTLVTGLGAVVGTPEYMSPEQASVNNFDIDTRSDVYSLGVLLYELLTGSTPVNRKSLGKAALLEVLRIVREVEAPRPSARLSTADTLPSIAANRRTEPAKLSGLLRGELDWVVMKALEKDRSRRFDSANGLARDIQRYLADEVVEARPPSTGYRLRKFVSRHKGQVMAASLVLLALVAGVIGTTIGLIEAKKQQQVAEVKEQEANDERGKAVAAAKEERKSKLEALEEKANALKAAEAERVAKLDADAKRQDAERNLAFAKKGNEILGSVFAGLNPKKIAESGRPLQDVLRENLVKAVKELDGSAIGDLLEVARMQVILGESLLILGESELAIKVFANARDTLKAKLGADHPYTLTSMNNLAHGYQAAGKWDLSIMLHEETLKLQKAKLGPDHPDTLRSMNNLASAYRAAGKWNLSLTLCEETLKLQKAKLGPDHPDTLTAMNNLALAYSDAGKLDLALTLHEETLKLIKAKLGPDHPDTLSSMNNLAFAYRAAGKIDLAIPLCEETLKLMKAKLGPDHPYTLIAMSNLAKAYRDSRKHDLALPLFEATFKLNVAKLGPDHPSTLISMTSLAVAYRDSGKNDLALPLCEETLKLMKAKLGPDHPYTLTAMNNLAMEYQAAGKRDLSLPLYEETLKLMKIKLGSDHPDTLSTMSNLGSAYSSSKQGAKAAPLLTAFVAARRKRSKPDHPGFAGLLAQVSLDLLLCDQFIAAEEMLRECLTIREKTQPDVWSTFNTQSLLGGAILGQKKYADAEPLLVKGYEGMKAREKTIPPQASTRIPEALDRLIALYTAMNKPGEVKKYQDLRSTYPVEVAPPPREKK